MTEGPTDQLRREHDLVLMVVEAMEREVADIERTGHVHSERVAQMIDFTRNFTDGNHHTKEEELLFPLLEERSASAGGTVSILLSEHEAARDCIRKIDAALPDAEQSAEARAAIAENLKLYAFLLRLHIGKEDTVLFPLTERLLNAQEQEMLGVEFMRVEEKDAGGDPNERYHALAHTLAEPPGA
jgi:hemerythrin-like domain-containing protein